MKSEKPKATNLICWAVFVFFFIFEHGEIGVITAFGNVVTLHSLANGAMGFVGVGAVVEPAIGRESEDFLEVVADLFLLHVEGAEAFDARGVDDVAKSPDYFVHLGEGGGVLARVVGIADFAGAEVEMGEEGVDQGRLPYSAIP